jgi:hypothetical protein
VIVDVTDPVSAIVPPSGLVIVLSSETGVVVVFRALCLEILDVEVPVFVLIKLERAPNESV